MTSVALDLARVTCVCRHSNIESNCAKCRENARYRRWYRDGGAAKVSARHKLWYLANREYVARKNAEGYARRKAEAR